jgi:hypothetical protein
MCDYSLYGIKNRLAVEHEVLTVHRFLTGSKGLTSPSYLEPVSAPKGFMAFLAQKLGEPASECAVCIPDGARLLMTGIKPALQASQGLFENETVTFRQLTMDEASHRDAVEFRNGLKIRLQELDEGQCFEVRALSTEETALRKEILDITSM